MRAFGYLFSLILAGAAFAASGSKAPEGGTEIVIGTTPGDFADLVREGLKPGLEKKGYRVRLVEFSDYVRPNLALAEGAIHANIFQHRPYLEHFVKEKGLRLKPLAEVPTAPLGLYAGRSKELGAVSSRSKVAVPNDPTNLARSLVILADLGWIELRSGIDPLRVSEKDIGKNLKGIRIVQLEAAQLPRVLPDVDFAIINGNYAVASGLALQSALHIEKSDAYVNWAVIREGDAQAPWAKDLESALQSPELRVFSRNKWKGYKFPSSWK